MGGVRSSCGTSRSAAMLRSRSAPALLMVALGVSMLVPATASAQSADQAAAAQALFDDAKASMRAGRYAEACPKLEESQRIDPGLGTLLNLAECYERLGRTATAWSKFLEAAAAAHAAGRPDGERVARQRANALVPRLTRLVVDVHAPEATPGLVVRRNGVIVGQAQWGASIPVDPGTHVVTAEAPGRVSWRGEVVVTAETPVANLMIPALDVVPAELDGSHAGTQPIASVEAPRDATLTQRASESDGFVSSDSGEPSDGRLGRTVAIALGAGGIACMGTSLVLGLIAKSQYDDVAEDCPNNECTPPAGAERDSARSKTDIATALFVVGAGALAGGVTLWLLTPARSEQRAGASLRVDLLPSGVMLRGAL